MSTIIKNGTIATASHTIIADILVDNGVIMEIGAGLNRDNATLIDAKQCIVIPGGIDVHTHFNLDVGIAVAQDDYYTGTIAAAFGGTTCIVDHPGFGPKGCGLDHQIAVYHAHAAGRAVIDYGFHGVIQHVDDAILDRMADLVAEGIPSFKAYMTYDGKLDHDDLSAVLKRLKALSGITTVHAEDDDMLVALKQSLLYQGHTDVAYFPASRPDRCEAQAVAQVLQLAATAGDAPLYIVHLSTASGLEKIMAARTRGQRNVYVETCPQYLLLDEALYQEPESQGLKYVMAPPLRQRADRQALWQGLRERTIDVVATDHCPFDFEKKKALGKHDFTRCPGGIPGVETRIPLLFSEGVGQKRIGLNRFVELVSTSPAKLMGLYPQKGTIAPGSDADLVIMDPNRRAKITHAGLHQNVDYTPYEGMVVQGWPVLTMVRGRVVVDGDRFVGEKGYGRFVKRKSGMAA